jgi:Bacteriocin-protection, YdeI or OmpD-Associated/Domain of unknown function (DUF1905)
VSDYVTFEGVIQPMVWGKSTYTILPVPADVVTALGNSRRVEGELNDHPVNLALTRAPVLPDVFLWAGQSLLDRVGIAPGDLVEVRLRPAPDDRVDVPDDVAFALRGVMAAWEAMTPGKRRGLLYQVETAKTAPTRAKRIAKLVESLA